MFGITGRQVCELRGAGGELFTAFVDALLRSHCFVLGVADAQIDTNLRTSIPDGGVDTFIRSAVPGDTTGRLSAAPTAWQYKGTEYRHINVDTLLEGTAIREHITNGAAFRLAVADSMPEPKKRDWEQRLTAAARAIRADAPEVRVVTADDLAAWASRYSALMMARFHPELLQIALHIEAWTANVADDTPTYVAVAEWQSIRAALAQHLDLGTGASRAVMRIQGEAGVGKTRLVHEVAAGMPGADSLVLYCQSGQDALRVAHGLANDPVATALLIADECDVEERLHIEQVLAGHRRRVRVVAIDNSRDRALGAQPELLVSKMQFKTLDEILSQNFPSVSAERRRAYAHLAEGFPRLATSLCKDDARIAAAGHVGPAVPAIDDYLQISLTPQQREALSALSLVTKVGYADPVGVELDRLCEMLGLSRPAVEQALDEIHDRQGFVGRTARYFYVTPEVVAQASYEDAWRRWGRVPESFFKRVPDDLVQAFLDRAWRSAPEEVRRACAEYFREWALAAAPEQLRDVATVRRLVALTDTHPGDYLAVLRRLVEAASHEVLLQVRGEGLGDGSWGPRRSLVWLAERLAQFAEYFDDAERILLRLALAESEPSIANNATAIWCQLYRVYLSGTAVTFGDRLERLRNRLVDGSPEVRALAMAALEGVFESHATRMLGPAVVAGRIAPEDWRPKTAEEEREAFLGGLNLLIEASSRSDELRDAAVSIAIKLTRWFVARGFFTQLREFLSGVDLTDDQLSALVEELDSTLAYDYDGQARRQQRTTGADTPSADEMAAWRIALVERSLHTRLVASVGKDRWAPSRIHHEVRARESAAGAGNDAFAQDIDALASELLGDPESLRLELPWLTSDAAKSAADLGAALGRLDSEGLLIKMILAAGAAGPSRLLAQGYLHGLLKSHPEHGDAVRTGLDEIENRHPDAGIELALAAGSLVNPLQRAFRLYDAGLISPRYLSDRNFTSTEGGELLPAEFALLLERLASAAEQGDMIAERIGLDAFITRLPYDVPLEPPKLFTEHPAVAELAWRLLEARPTGSPPASRWWRHLVVALGRLAPDRATRLAAAVLGSRDLRASEEGETALIALAVSSPTEVMKALGETMLDDKAGWRFFIGDFHALVAALPPDIVQEWIEEAGVEGARRLARHLPQPIMGPDGTPVVPDLTLWVLTRFEEDDRTFQEFCAGVHSFQVYSGDIAAQHEAEAALARYFLHHPARRIREWAALEERSAIAEAREARRREEESDLP